MRKLLSAVLAASMVLSMTACGGSQPAATTAAPAAETKAEETKAAEARLKRPRLKRPRLKLLLQPRALSGRSAASDRSPEALQSTAFPA